MSLQTMHESVSDDSVTTIHMIPPFGGLSRVTIGNACNIMIAQVTVDFASLEELLGAVKSSLDGTGPAVYVSDPGPFGSGCLDLTGTVYVRGPHDANDWWGYVRVEQGRIVGLE